MPVGARPLPITHSPGGSAGAILSAAGGYLAVRGEPHDYGTRGTMGSKKKGKGRREPQVKGFRPGKEPPRLRKQRAKARLGTDASWAQKQMVEAVGDRSPGEVRAMIRKWSVLLLVMVVLLAVGGVALYRWAVAAGVAAHVIAALLLFLLVRIRRKGEQMVQFTESLGGKGHG